MTPNPTAPTSASSSQPTLHTFFSRTSSAIRQSVSSVLDMTPAPTQRRSVRSVLDSSSDSDSDNDNMDTSENRKRPRPDSIMGADITEQNLSASMIANTSIQETGPARRRRISSADAGPSIPPDLTSTPDENNTQSRILDQMNTIRDDIILEEISPQVSTNRNTNLQDLSTTSEQFNLNNLVTGVRQITRDIANIQQGSSLTWDDNDINLPSLPMISPRPVPAMAEDVPNDNNPLLLPQPVPTIADVHTDATARCTPPPTAPPPAQSTPDLLHSLKDMVQEQFRTAYENIEQKLLGSIRDHVRTSEQQYEENKEGIAIVSARVDNVEQDIERHQFEIENISEDLETHSGHINRIDEALGVITHASNQPIQDLLARIAALEASQVQSSQVTSEERETIDRIKKRMQKEDDRYYMSTLVIKGFNPEVVTQNNYGARSTARAVLRIIGSEDVIGFTSKISFKNDNTKMRLTYDHPNDYQAAIHHLSRSIKQIKDAGHNPGILFSTLSPPRFQRERDILQKIAEDMKRDGQIDRFCFVLAKNKLCLKVSKRGQRDSLIHVPAETEDMEVSVPEEDQAGSRCPICLSPFDNNTQINVYACGHTFHTPCLRSSLAQSMKCPTCRSIPHQIQLEIIECIRCRSDILDPQSLCNQDQIVLSRRCNHLHLHDCQTNYINTLEGSFPATAEGYHNITTAENIQGCASCFSGVETSFQHNTIIHEVQYQDGMSDYIDLEAATNNTPTHDPPPQPPLSGANAIPIAAAPARPINRPVNPPPPPPSGRRQRNRRN